jgi:hypothetical protein
MEETTEERQLRMYGFVVARAREEWEPCERGTDGCSVAHGECEHDECEPW